MESQPGGLAFFVCFDRSFLRPVGSKRPSVERDKLSPSAGPSIKLRNHSATTQQPALRQAQGPYGDVLRLAQQPLKCRGKEKKLNKYLVVCGFWCTFAAKLRIGCRKGFICAWLI